ncbi:MAG: flavin reductase family protein [Pseudomonadota bacterium]
MTENSAGQFHSYHTAEGHRLPHDPLKAIVAPRPICWVSTIDENGVRNLAPYSFFNMVNTRPPLVMFSSEGAKDSVQNIRETGDFTCNLATMPLSTKMNHTSADAARHVDEFDLAGIEAAPSAFVRPPRVAASPASLECRAIEVKQLEDIHGAQLDTFMVIGQVVMVHIDKRCLVNGYFDIVAAQTISRAGYRGDYVLGDQVFEMLRPSDGG